MERKEDHQTDQVGGWTDGQTDSCSPQSACSRPGYILIFLPHTIRITYITPSDRTVDEGYHYLAAHHGAWWCCAETEPSLLLGCMYQSPESTQCKARSASHLVLTRIEFA